MSNRYSDRQRITGKLSGQLRKIIVEVLDGAAALQTFVKEKIGRDAANSINWSQATAYSSSELISHCLSRGKFALLVEQLLEVKGDNAELEGFVAYLVDAGYLNDSTKEPVATTNPRNRDWVSDFPFDRVSFTGQTLKDVSSQIAACFATTAAVERFLGDNFKQELGTQLRHGIDRAQPVATVIERLVNELARIKWLNCFIMAVQTSNQDQFELGMSAVAIELAYRPPAPKAAATAPVAAKPAAPAPAPVKAFKVVRATGKLTPALSRELVELLLRAFQRDDLGRLVHYNLDVRLENIVANGPFGKVCEDLVRWCEEQESMLAPLLNAMLKERPSRSDIKPFLEKLAAANVIELDK